MKAGGEFRVVLVTCESLRGARRIAQQVVSKRLAACVNVVRSPVESIYAWKGKMETAREYLLLVKTTASRLIELEREVHRLHGYKVPEFVALSIEAGSAKYLAWVQESVSRRRKRLA